MSENQRKVVEAFLSFQSKRAGALSTNGKEIFSYALRLAYRDVNQHVVKVFSREDRMPSVTTARHRNLVDSVIEEVLS